MIKNNDFGRDQHRQTLLLHYEHIFDLDNRRVTAKIYHEDGMINTQDK